MDTNGKWEKLYGALERIYSEYGSSVISEPSKVKGLILDFAPMVTNEARAFSNVLAVQEIIRYISSDEDIYIEYLVSKIADNMGFSTEWAEKIAVGLLMLTGRSAQANIELVSSSEKEIKDLTANTLITTTTIVQDDSNSMIGSKTQLNNTQSYEQRLISSGYSRLSNKLWDRAKEDFEIALRTSSHPRAYVGLMMSTLHIRVEKEIPLCDSAIEDDPNWKTAMKYATGSYKDKLQRYAREHRRLISIKKKNTSSPKGEKTVTVRNTKPTSSLPSKTASMQTDTNKDKVSLSAIGMIMFFLGLAAVLVSFVFGIYGWFANTGLSLLMYYLIITGGSIAGLLMICFDELKSSKEEIKKSLQFAAICGLAVPIVVTIIGLIGNLIIWIVNLI